MVGCLLWSFVFSLYLAIGAFVSTFLGHDRYEWAAAGIALGWPVVVMWYLMMLPVVTAEVVARRLRDRLRRVVVPCDTCNQKP